MNLNFNIGSIVKFELSGFSEPIVKIGKVIDVNSTEVVIIPQLHVYRLNKSYGNDVLDMYCTADDDYIIHIRRSLIATWTYAKANDIEIREFISESDVHSVLTVEPTKRFNDYNINQYDHETGFHKGDGRNCSLIKEA